MTDIDEYLRADGTVRDYRRAFPVLLQLAEDGNASDQNLVGYCFGTGSGVRRNHSKAAAWYQRAVAGGSIEAIGNLALAYEKGRGVARNLKRAFRLYAKGARLGDPWCQTNLGVRYAEGRGTKRDMQKAAGWWRKASRKGDARAQFNLGVAYLDGDDVRRSDRLARLWLTKAASNGHAVAAKILRKQRRSLLRPGAAPALLIDSQPGEE